ncbi:MAG: hypothetical protein Q4D38_04815 [Planctomycetia bacterium]|nr:hypothetical protein [Planctomycetia bacterium]
MSKTKNIKNKTPDINAYSPCPGGTGKKIKFCCPQRVDDFKKVYKYLDACQYTACLNFIDTLLEKDAEKACLLAIRCLVLKSFPDRELELIQTAKKFYDLHPENPIAIAESAQAILLEGRQRILDSLSHMNPTERMQSLMHERSQIREVLKETIERYEKAFSSLQNFQYEQVFEKLEFLVKALAAGGLYESAVSWIALVLDSDVGAEVHDTFVQLLHQIKTSRAVPLCFRLGLKLQLAPEGVPWKEDFDRIVTESVLCLHWREAIEQFKTLAETTPEVSKAPSVWYNLALLHEWMCDLEGASVMWKRYIACPEAPFYDALEKQIRVSMFHENPLEDEMDVCTIRYTVSDPEAVLGKIYSEPTLINVPAMRMQRVEGGVLLAAFDLADVPPVRDTTVAVEDLPIVMGNVLVWARQTDREPRVEVINVMKGAAKLVQEQLEGLFGEWIVGEPETIVTRKISVTVDALLRKILFPAEMSPEQKREMKNAQCREILLKRWLHFPLGIFQRHSMSEVAKVAKNPKYRFRIEAALYFLRTILERERFDVKILDELRDQLELPPLPLVNSAEADSLSPLFFDQLDWEALTPEQFKKVFFIARVYNTSSIPKSALTNAVYDEKYPPATRVEALKALWGFNPEAEVAREYIRLGREICAQHQISDVFFDVMEAGICISENKFQRGFEMIKHVRQDHADDAEALQYIAHLDQYMQGRQQSLNLSEIAARQSALHAAGERGASELWLPGENAAKKQGEKSKLWIPD